MIKSNIIYFIPDEIIRSSGVLQSQVLGQARFLSNNGYRCLVISSDINEAMAIKAKELIQDDGLVRACVADRLPNKIPFFSKWLSSREIHSKYQEKIREFNPSHIYTRSVVVFGAASRIAKLYNLTHIHDVRGIPTIETLLQQTRVRGRIYSYGLYLLEKNSLNNANRLSCVSHRMGSWIESRC